jgi:succinyl-diaminopimelate desuccinylase
MTPLAENVLREIDVARAELVEFAAELLRVPTVNPPGAFYRECAELIGRRLKLFGFDVDYPEADASPADSARYPRINVVGIRRGRHPRPLVHLNGHFDVVPAGDGWSVDPFGGLVRDGCLWGRGSADMKAGLAAAIYAAEAVRRAGVELAGSIEVSGTVDEESGGFAGVCFLAQTGRISAARTDYVIIPEPFSPHRICIGHRGVYWYKITAHGRIAHGSMPHQGLNAIDQMGVVLEKIRAELGPSLKVRETAMPVVPPEARFATINTNAISGGQAGQAYQTPCVADRCEAIFDRRFLIEEGFDAARAGIVRLIEGAMQEDSSRRYELEDLMVVEPTRTSPNSLLVRTLAESITKVLGREADLVASPGTYDHKHVARIAGVEQCVAYGPGVLEQAHQPDEWCAIDDIVNSAKVMALTLLELVGVR